MKEGRKRTGKKSIPPWDEMDKQKGLLDRWIDKARLPQILGFHFSKPSRMSSDDCRAMAEHIIKGEVNLLPTEQRFRWRGQVDGPLHATPKPTAKRQLDIVDSEEDDSEPMYVDFYSFLNCY